MNPHISMERHYEKIIVIILMIFGGVLFKAHQPYGTKLGSYNDVICYSNDSNSYVSNDSNYYNSTYTGMKWQCVEFVNRYYLIIYSKNIRVEGTKP
jgi:hypothetical protein